MTNLQWYLAAQYLFYRQLYVKVVGGYAKSHFENKATSPRTMTTCSAFASAFSAFSKPTSIVAHGAQLHRSGSRSKLVASSGCLGYP